MKVPFFLSTYQDGYSKFIILMTTWAGNARRILPFYGDPYLIIDVHQSRFHFFGSGHGPMKLLPETSNSV